ncbi:hypothetical protein TWF225_000629 [Orbilia oligospora]|uniref:Uncharacterized protein n=1 Tax=Orbilia oligospora TaxID=2813651 RepID=A0A7C8PNV3_ORBOL|nr:hypothetical protein TWF751_003032 [Orbilia oligospora]KAF3192382.1 hypothetical protein TWF225_000629 [Orbilia oligospora]KAF3264708.1 hypothetical protein TWF128_001159 [Orbilia oligospora]KAF3268493.1 hypothetical protein TWF217_011076 [Orbilia oligospora]KAF3280366.1 hypothetical protein TWF132_011825 [Orbilia oligospora]
MFEVKIPYLLLSNMQTCLSLMPKEELTICPHVHRRCNVCCGRRPPTDEERDEDDDERVFLLSVGARFKPPSHGQILSFSSHLEIKYENPPNPPTPYRLGSHYYGKYELI